MNNTETVATRLIGSSMPTSSSTPRAIRPVMESSHQARNAFIPSIPPHQRQRVNVTFRHLI